MISIPPKYLSPSQDDHFKWKVESTIIIMVVIDSTMSSLSKLRRNGRLLNWRPSPPHCSPLTGDEARKLLSEFSQIIVVSNFVWNFLKLYGALWMLRVLEPAASTRRQHLQQKWRSLSIVISYHRHHCQLSFKLSASLSIVIHIISIIVNCDMYISPIWTKYHCPKSFITVLW